MSDEFALGRLYTLLILLSKLGLAVVPKQENYERWRRNVLFRPTVPLMSVKTPLLWYQLFFSIDRAL